MSKQSRKKRRETKSSSKAQHSQTKSKLVPPLLTAIPNWDFVTWERDALPDALWVCSVLTRLPQLEAMHCIKDVLDRIQDRYDEAFPDCASEMDQGKIFDGTLTSLKRVPTEIRASVLEALRSDGLYDVAFPNEFAHSLGMYADAPSRWLIQPILESNFSIDWEIAQDHLWQVITLAAHGQSQTSTDAKYMLLRAYYRAGKIHYAPHLKDTIDLFVRYPNGLSEEQLQKARPTIRATFNVLFGALANE